MENSVFQARWLLIPLAGLFVGLQFWLQQASGSRFPA